MTNWHVAHRDFFARGDNPFHNSFYGYQRTQLVLPDGSPAIYHGIDVGDCVHVVPLDDDLTTYLVRQKRPNLLRPGMTEVPETWELPGGFVGDREIEVAALEELAQEVGKRALRLTKAGVLYTAPGVSNETDTIYVARQLIDQPDAYRHEATEQDLQVMALPFGEAFDTLRSGREPATAATLAALAMAARTL
jgi:hypothetical protein